jgi:hypothetical protein
VRKLLIGPALTGCGWLAGSYYGADAEQVVHKGPGTVRAAVEAAVSNRDSGTMQFEGGKTVPYELRIDDGASDDHIVVRMTINGKEAAQTDILLTPQNSGENTLMVVKVHTDHTVLREELAGTPKARLAYAPDWMLNLTVRPVLQKLAEQIERGEAVGDPLRGFQSEADWEASLPPDKQKQMQEWRQYSASRPMMDPNEAPRNYMKPGER